MDRLVAVAALVVAMVAAACQTPKPAPASTAVGNATAPEPRPDVPLAEGVEVLLATSGDVDGAAGAESIQLRSNGLVVAGARSAPAPIDRISDMSYWKDASQLLVVELDTGVRAVYLITPTEGIEDPPERHRLFVVDGDALRQVLDDVVSTPRTGLRFPGDGTARYDEGAWGACERRGYPQVPVPIDEIVLAADASGTLRESGRRSTGKTFDCENLAACPYVYVVDAAGARRVGEVLRNVRGEAAYTLQSLDLPAPTASAMTIRIAEEKPEITYLDEVYVEIDGVRHAPRACAAEAPPAYCAADHVPYVMREGDALDLELDVAIDGAAAIFARGYYIPLDAGSGAVKQR
jgi:hypothetical protein